MKEVNFELWKQLGNRRRKIVYNSQKGVSLRDLVEVLFYLHNVDNEDLMFDYLHFKHLRNWGLL